MELSDDWDPSYLKLLFNEDFHDFSDLWFSNVKDTELVLETEKVECYCPLTEDISLDDESICRVVEQIEHE